MWSKKDLNFSPVNKEQAGHDARVGGCRMFQGNANHIASGIQPPVDRVSVDPADDTPKTDHFHAIAALPLSADLAQVVRLKHIQDEVVAPMIAANCGRRPVMRVAQYSLASLVHAQALHVVVVPGAVVYRNPHLLWVTVVQALGTAIVFVAPIVLWIEHVWVMIKPLPVVCVIGMSPVAVERAVLGLGIVRAAGDVSGSDAHCDQKQTAEHGFPPGNVYSS